MTDYSGRCWHTYLRDGNADGFVKCVYKGVVENCGEEGGNAKAIRALVNLADERGQQTYIKLKEVREMIGGIGGLYPWLKKHGADILEKKPGYSEFRIQKKFYQAMLSLYPSESTTDPAQGIMRLKGLGKEIWAGIDAQDYVNRERAAWAG